MMTAGGSGLWMSLRCEEAEETPPAPPVLQPLWAAGTAPLLWIKARGWGGWVSVPTGREACHGALAGSVLSLWLPWPAEGCHQAREGHTGSGKPKCRNWVLEKGQGGCPQLLRSPGTCRLPPIPLSLPQTGRGASGAVLHEMPHFPAI